MIRLIFILITRFPQAHALSWGQVLAKRQAFLVSYDGGFTYVDDIHINKKPVTHVRWLFDSVPARAKGEVGFKLHIERANHGLFR
jgi:hypothetical protein